VERHALIIGASSAIGAATAIELQKSGWIASGTFRETRPPKEAADLLSLQMPCDVRDPDQIASVCDAAAQQVRPIDALIYTVGNISLRKAERLRSADVVSAFEVNTLGAISAVREVLGGMQERRYGRVVLVSSIAAFQGSAGSSVYASSKGALVGFARSVVKEVAHRGITVNVVEPGFIRSSMLDRLPVAHDQLTGRIPTRRIGEPSEVAALIAFLCSEAAGYINGASIPVDGGASFAG